MQHVHCVIKLHFATKLPHRVSHDEDIFLNEGKDILSHLLNFKINVLVPHALCFVLLVILTDSAIVLALFLAERLHAVKTIVCHDEVACLTRNRLIVAFPDNEQHIPLLLQTVIVGLSTLTCIGTENSTDSLDINDFHTIIDPCGIVPDNAVRQRLDVNSSTKLSDVKNIAVTIIAVHLLDEFGLGNFLEISIAVLILAQVV